MPLPAIKLTKIPADTQLQLPLENSSDGCIMHKLKAETIKLELSGGLSRSIVIYRKDLEAFLAGEEITAVFDI